MSIFGQLDAEQIPSNPYFIEKGTYAAEVTKAFFKTNRDGQRQLVFEFTVDEEDSEYNTQKIQKYFDLVDSDMTREKFELLPNDEKKKIRQSNSVLKKTLCGNGSTSKQKGLGVDPSDLNDPDWDPTVTVGLKINMGISNYGQDNTGVNVNWVNLRDEE